MSSAYYHRQAFLALFHSKDKIKNFTHLPDIYLDIQQLHDLQ